MGAPAIVTNDQITGVCPNHLIIGPLGVPTPAPALPFAAPLTMGLSTNVLIGGKLAAVQGSFGLQHAAPRRPPRRRPVHRRRPSRWARSWSAA